MPIGTIRELSLRQRLLLLTMLTSGIGVLLGCLGFLAYDMHVAKEHKEEDLRSVADLVGTNSTAALAFDDAIGGVTASFVSKHPIKIPIGPVFYFSGIFFAGLIDLHNEPKILAGNALLRRY